MNVLLTSSGRRTYLVEFFRRALQGKGLVFASNSVMSPALYAADGYGISPLIYSGEYLPWLLEFCREHEIGLLVPLFDVDLPVLAKARGEFEKAGVRLAVSSCNTVFTANDKFAMTERLKKAGIGVPDACCDPQEALSAVSAGKLTWPLLLKPRYGMGSIGICEAEDPEELRVLYRQCARKVEGSYLRYESAASPGKTVLIQPKLTGKEYGLDVICDLDGHFRAAVIRKKLAMRAGETDEAVILGPADPEYAVLCDTARRLSETFEIRGNLDVDVILDPAEGIPRVIDMNARFGGGYPFSDAAGVRLPEALLLWAEGKEAPEELLRAEPGVHGYKDLSVKRCPQPPAEAEQTEGKETGGTGR